MAGDEGAVLLVTGGAGGIGQATIRRWQEGGGRGVALDLPGRVADGDCAYMAVEGDVADESAVRRAVDEVVSRLGRIDAVFHNAGVLGPAADVTKLALEDWHRVFAVHATGGFLVAKHTLPHLRTRGGTLVFNASMVAETGAPAYAAYAAAKAALVSLTRSLAIRNGRARVRVNAVSPGSVVGTGLLRESRGSNLTAEELATLVNRIPLARAATPQDIAEAVCYLASPAARHVTGVVLPVDGGERFRW